MFVSRRTKVGHHGKHLSLKRFLSLFVILQVTTIYEGLANRIGAVSETQCAQRWTCRSCTEITTPACSWSVAEQTCANSTSAERRLVVTDGSFCPKFSVNSTGDNNEITVTVTVNDVDMGGGFVGLLANSSNVECRFDSQSYEATVVGDRISCAVGLPTLEPESGYTIGCQQFEPTVTHLLIVFDGIPLRFDHVNNHYVVTYSGLGDCEKVECLNCQQDHGTYRSYCWRCSAIYHCDVRNISSFERLSPENVLVDRNRTCFIGGPTGIKSSLEVVQSDQSLSVVGPAVNNGTKVGPTLKDGQAVVVNGTLIDVTVDVGQVFAGIASGGTTLRVRGQHFSGLQNTKVCIKTKYFCGRCEVHNDTLMVCRSPATTLTTNQLTDKKVRFYEHNSITGEFLKLNHSSLDIYHPYQDPVFTGFVLDGCCNVTVNGMQLDRGYAVEDISIILVAENSSSGCHVTLIGSTQITCQVSSSRSDLPPKQINVTVGNFLSVVKPTKQKSSSFKRFLGVFIFPGIVTISAYVLFIAVLCVAVVYYTRSSKDYDLLHSHGSLRSAEIRSLGDQNPNDCEDENMLMPLSVRDETY